MGILTKSHSVAGDTELSKAMLIYYPGISNMYLHHNQTFYPRLVLTFRYYYHCLHLSVCPFACVCISHLLVRVISQDLFKLRSPNWNCRCKTHWLRSCCFEGWLILTFSVEFKLKKSIFPVSPWQEKQNYHTNTREPWVPRLLHGPVFFMVSILCTYLHMYT